MVCLHNASMIRIGVEGAHQEGKEPSHHNVVSRTSLPHEPSQRGQLCEWKSITLRRYTAPTNWCKINWLLRRRHWPSARGASACRRLLFSKRLQRPKRRRLMRLQSPTHGLRTWCGSIDGTSSSSNGEIKFPVVFLIESNDPVPYAHSSPIGKSSFGARNSAERI
jgi:hypothetical protein